MSLGFSELLGILVAFGSIFAWLNSEFKATNARISTELKGVDIRLNSEFQAIDKRLDKFALDLNGIGAKLSFFEAGTSEILTEQINYLKAEVAELKSRL